MNTDRLECLLIDKATLCCTECGVEEVYCTTEENMLDDFMDDVVNNLGESWEYAMCPSCKAREDKDHEDHINDHAMGRI